MQVSMRTLAIETSCDETAAAVLAPDGRVEANLLSSQVTQHAPFGGVVPELASREHLLALPRLVEQALATCNSEVELVAVTNRPGLIGALLVGVRFAAAFAWARALPLVAVDHLQGHQVSPFLSLDPQTPARTLPRRTLALVASGGHSAWYLLTRDSARCLCQSRDDAAGEVFDKIAQALGLTYPGGPVIDRLARRGTATMMFSRPRLKDGSRDLSFSGLKSAAMRWLHAEHCCGIGEAALPASVYDFLASFEQAVVSQLVAPLPSLIEHHRPDLVTASGGVAANSLLRSHLQQECHQLGLELLLPAHALTTDNAAMIGRAGQLAFQRGERHDPRRLDAQPRQAWQPPGMRHLG